MFAHRYACTHYSAIDNIEHKMIILSTIDSVRNYCISYKRLVTVVGGAFRKNEWLVCCMPIQIRSEERVDLKWFLRKRRKDMSQNTKSLCL